MEARSAVRWAAGAGAVIAVAFGLGAFPGVGGAKRRRSASRSIRRMVGRLPLGSRAMARSRFPSSAKYWVTVPLVVGGAGALWAQGRSRGERPAMATGEVRVQEPYGVQRVIVEGAAIPQGS